jgi:hypothetical protein
MKKSFVNLSFTSLILLRRRCQLPRRFETFLLLTKSSDIILIYYLVSGDFSPQGVDWGTTWSGRGEADKEMNVRPALASCCGEYVSEKTFFGGISCAEFELDPIPMQLVEIGLMKDNIFYPHR